MINIDDGSRYDKFPPARKLFREQDRPNLHTRNIQIEKRHPASAINNYNCAYRIRSPAENSIAPIATESTHIIKTPAMAIRS